MKLKLITVVLCMAFLISFSSAYLGTFEQNKNITLKGNIEATSANLTVYYPNTTKAVTNQAMANIYGDIYSYEFSTTSVWGLYTYDYCDQAGENCKENTFRVNYFGEDMSNIAEGITWFLFILAVIGNITFLILTLVKLAISNETIFGVLSAWGFYVLMIIVNFQSGLMTTSFIHGISGFFLTILVWSNGVLPAISLVVTMFVKGTQKKKPLSVQEMTGQTPFGRFA